jgi:serine phosphatase RsbU (regulator of sigma subunit)
MHNIAIITFSQWVRNYFDDEGILPNAAISQWETVTTEEFAALQEESERLKNMGEASFIVVEQTLNVRNFIDMTVRDRLAAIEAERAEKEAELEAKREKARAATARKRLAEEEKERKTLADLARKYGHPAASEGHLSLL